MQGTDLGLCHDDITWWKLYNAQNERNVDTKSLIMSSFQKSHKNVAFVKEATVAQRVHELITVDRRVLQK